jgi:hypothetical protein
MPRERQTADDVFFDAKPFQYFVGVSRRADDEFIKARRGKGKRKARNFCDFLGGIRGFLRVLRGDLL